MRRLSVYLIALVATCVAVVASVSLISERTDLLDRFRDEEVAPPPEIRPAPGQAFVTGTATRVVAVADEVPQVTSPFTLTPLVRGVGRATIENAIVDGKRTTISWAGGTALTISGTGALELNAPVNVTVETSGITWALDGGARNLVPGTYRAQGSVAVGTAGLAAPRDQQSFAADAQTVIQSRDGVVIKVPPGRLVLKGPGKLALDGTLRVQFPDSARQAGKVEFGEGQYEITVNHSGTGLTVDAVLQGPVRTT